jgi:uncharacterized protein with HEPN domain
MTNKEIVVILKDVVEEIREVINWYETNDKNEVVDSSEVYDKVIKAVNDKLVEVLK